MTVRAWVAVLAAGLLLGLVHGAELRGSDAKASVVAPVPRQILTARKIFIANGAATSGPTKGRRSAAGQIAPTTSFMPQ
jgi:hypothetical protein